MTPIPPGENERYVINTQTGDVTVEEIPQEELVLLLEVQANAYRAKRNDLLAASDWTQVADAPVDQAAWAAYRQALRDVPQQEGFPHSVIWPTKPE